MDMYKESEGKDRRMKGISHKSAAMHSKGSLSSKRAHLVKTLGNFNHQGF
jgi:hypothetical protein